MIGEWYVRTILPLYTLRNIEIINSTDIKIYLMNWLNNPLFNSHHLFIEPFTRYPLLSLKDLLLNKLQCVCFDRMLFLGFKKENHFWLPQDDILFFKSLEYTNRMNNEIIKFYKSSFNKIDSDLNKDSFLFKKDLIQMHLKKEIEQREVYKWKLIGLYDRKYRRKWLNINEICNLINDYKYYLCYKIILETEIGNLYSRDILKIHNNLDLVIGIHGAQLTDGIFTKEKGSIIELLLEHSESWTQDMDIPTPLGRIFQGSNLFHVGVLLQKKNQFHQNETVAR